MADAMISPVVGATMYVASGLVAADSIRKIRKEEDFNRRIINSMFIPGKECIIEYGEA